MEAGNILTADILDIIFEHQNKDYGAYQLRKSYHKRMKMALTGTFLFCVVLTLTAFLKRQDKMLVRSYLIPEYEIKAIAEDKKIAPVIPKIKTPQIQTIQYTIPKIQKEVRKEEVPPEVSDVDQAKISTFSQAGEKDERTEVPTVDSKGVFERLQEDDMPEIFTKVEIESSFPGGMQSWIRYLIKNLQYPSDASEAGIQGCITVKFVVDQDGSTSAVEVIEGPKELRDEAIRVIQRSGKWTPAIQNGKKVKSYKEQKIIFKLSE